MKNINKLKEISDKTIKYLKSRKFKNKDTNIFAKIVVSIIIWIICLIPFWIYLLIRLFMDPIGFWQELALFLVCIFCMGWAQLPLIFLGALTTFNIIFDDGI